MSLIIKTSGGSTTIPSNATINLKTGSGTVALTKINVKTGSGTVTVWKKGTPVSWEENTYSRSTSWTETRTSTHDFGSAKELISVYMYCNHHVDCPTTRYRVFGSNNNSSWTQLAEWNTNGGGTTINITGTYRYVKLEQYQSNWHNTSYSDPWVYSCEPWRINYYQ